MHRDRDLHSAACVTPVTFTVISIAREGGPVCHMLLCTCVSHVTLYLCVTCYFVSLYFRFADKETQAPGCNLTRISDLTRIRLLSLPRWRTAHTLITVGHGSVLAVSQGGLEFHYVIPEGYCIQMQYQNISRGKKKAKATHQCPIGQQAARAKRPVCTAKGNIDRLWMLNRTL